MKYTYAHPLTGKDTGIEVDFDSHDEHKPPIIVLEGQYKNMYAHPEPPLETDPHRVDCSK